MIGSSGLNNFDFIPRTRIVFGTGSVERVGELVSEFGGRRAMVVTDSGIVAAGHVNRVEKSLRASSIEPIRFDRVIENPTTEIVEDCLAVAREAKIDFFVAIGGGSSMDTAKGCNFLLSCGGKMEDYWGVGKAKHPMLPLVAIPTTAGTGSECQSFALISQTGTHVKMACGDTKAAAKAAILDPELTLTQPHAVAATTGMDALSHAVEAAVTNRRNPISQMLSREAFRLCAAGLPLVLSEPGNLAARGDMLLGAALAGLAIENSMLGAAHAAANPLTARYGVIHGQAVGLMLPAVVRFNGQDPHIRSLYHQLVVQADMVREGHDSGDGPELLADRITSFRALAGMPSSLAAVKVGESEIESLAGMAAQQWTAGFNPRPVSAHDFVQLYRSVLI